MLPLEGIRKAATLQVIYLLFAEIDGGFDFILRRAYCIIMQFIIFTLFILAFCVAFAHSEVQRHLLKGAFDVFSIDGQG